MRTAIGIPSTIMCSPVRAALADLPAVEVISGTPFDVAGKLRRSEVAAALVSPIEYARESSHYRILPDFALSSRKGVSLYFRKGLKSVKTLAADPAGVAEIVLARIVMAEEFEIVPAIVPVQTGSVEDMLARADAALLSGDALLRNVSSHPDYIDLLDLWCDLVEYPFVHTLLCARDGALDEAALQQIQVASGVLSSGPIDNRHFTDLNGVDKEAISAFLTDFTYGMTRDAREGLREFLCYAHFHGVLADIPDLMSYASPSADGVSPN